MDLLRGFGRSGNECLVNDIEFGKNDGRRLGWWL